MPIQANITFTEQNIQIDLLEQPLTIAIFETSTAPESEVAGTIYLAFKQKKLVFIGQLAELTQKKVAFTQLITLQPQLEVEVAYLTRLLINQALAAGVKLTGGQETAIPANILPQLVDINTIILLILTKMGYPLTAIKKHPAKARHKWSKEVSEIDFFIDTRESLAIVRWLKRDQMLIKKGATMMQVAPLNKDGSVGFDAKMGEKIRSDHQEQFKDFVTTEDIILKSVNEVGLFLYYAGTNSWLEMVDQDGKTLNEWTTV
ncbi:MAG: hypothetical protein ACK5MW_02710 [Enterococcus sp.]